jgi:vesicle-associated membrane protein 7
MTDYNNTTKIDKFSSLRKELTELEEQALDNMNKVIERGEKIEILVKKSETMADQSYDMKNTSTRIRRKMWWKNKKIMIGVIIVGLVLLILIIGLIAGWFS